MKVTGDAPETDCNMLDPPFGRPDAIKMQARRTIHPRIVRRSKSSSSATTPVAERSGSIDARSLGYFGFTRFNRAADRTLQAAASIVRRTLGGAEDLDRVRMRVGCRARAWGTASGGRLQCFYIDAVVLRRMMV
jgi:hypothetical protein